MIPRPINRSREVLLPAMEELFNKEIKDIELYSDLDRDEAINQLVKNYSPDGFEFGKNLEGEFWDVDFSLCEILNNGLFYVDKHLKKQMTDWVKTNPIIPYKVGEEVVVKRPFSVVNNKTCFVTSIKQDIAQYTVIEKEKYKTGMFGGYVVNHEELIPVEKEVHL